MTPFWVPLLCDLRLSSCPGLAKSPVYSLTVMRNPVDSEPIPVPIPSLPLLGIAFKPGSSIDCLRGPPLRLSHPLRGVPVFTYSGEPRHRFPCRRGRLSGHFFHSTGPIAALFLRHDTKSQT